MANVRTMRTALCLTLLFATSCSDPDEGLSESCIEARTHSDFDFVQTEIFDKSCNGFSSCHQGNALQAGGLNLEGGMAEATMDSLDPRPDMDE